VSRNKKKKITGQNLSLSERLGRNWAGKKWEAFVSLYMRDRDASDRGPWAARLPDALYNCLTAALFLRKNLEGARQIAEIMLTESSLGPDGDLLRMCAQTALDLINIREGRSSAPSDDGGLQIALPAPYGELRQRLIAAFTPTKPGRRRQGASNKTVEKLAKQFKALPSAKNSAPYASFLKTAEALVTETEGSGASAIFKAVRDIAFIMRDIAHGGSDGRDKPSPAQFVASSGYQSRVSHPALQALWKYMCGLGGRKFGPDWERTANVARMSLLCSGEAFKTAYDKLMPLEEGFSEDFPVIAERYYDGWTEQERFILIFLAVTEYARKGPGDFEELSTKTLLRWFKTLGDIGRRRRSGSAWPAAVRFAFHDWCTQKVINDTSEISAIVP
jgi:hypothetical protein